MKKSTSGRGGSENMLKRRKEHDQNKEKQQESGPDGAIEGKGLT